MKLALRLPQFNRNFVAFAAAIVLAIGAVILINTYLQQQKAQAEAAARGAHKLVTVVVAKQDLPRGTRIQPGAFATRQIPKEYLHSSSIVAEQFGRYVGQKLGSPLKAGEPLLDVYLESASTVFSSTLENGNRALTTEVDEVNSISGMLRPTDHIDLMATARGTANKSREITFPLLTNVEVLATGTVTRKGEGGGEQKRTYTTITLSVSAEDAQRIVVAKSSGKLTATLRNPDDDRANLTPAMNIDDVLPKKKSNGPHPIAVQYIVGIKG